MSTQQGDIEWFRAVQAAFPDQELCRRIWTEAHQPTQLPQLFGDISRYVLSLKAQPAINHELPTNSKKRKLEDGTVQTNGVASTEIAGLITAFECKDVSVQIPARKKLKVRIVGDAADPSKNSITLLNSADDLESALAGKNIESVFCLPVPDKQQRQSYFAVLPKAGAGIDDGVPSEPILFTLNDIAPASLAVSAHDPITPDNTYVTATRQALNRLLQQYGKQVIVPDPAEFVSARTQAHRKGEKGYHVSCYRGSKEGYLYFLPTGILFGFKKPLSFYHFSAISSISYTSVLQRTFNLVIAASAPSDASADPEVKEVEFSMLDQEDFAGIDEYVKRHGLNDASLAAGRRAKEYGVNKDKKAEVNGDVAADAGAGGGVGDDGLTELQRAEQELQDAEDEEEEDYEASGGESDGEGEGEESDEDEDGEGYEDADGEDMEDEDAEGVEDGDDDL